MQLADDTFSVISLRQGTVCGYSPRMRLDLVVNTMFKSALQNGAVTVNNPAIWRPILAVQDAAQAYIRALESADEITGIFNVASGNYTVGEIADLVCAGVAEHFGVGATLDIRHMKDFRNYKVSIEKAKTVLSFKPRHDIESIVRELAVHHDKFRDYDNPLYYNIRVFTAMEEQGRNKRIC
jgi:nucleoside-diphosphate-sugar epimerase